MNLRDCFQKRLLRRVKPDTAKSTRSLEVASTKLEEAKRALKNELFDAAIILSYTATFHAARALLFRDGVVEKSHVCLIEYLRAEYVRKGRLSGALVNTLNSLRIDRHETIYGLETKSGVKEADYAFRKAKEFLEGAKRALARNMQQLGKPES